MAGTFARESAPTSGGWQGEYAARAARRASLRGRIEEAEAIEQPHERALALKRLRVEAASALSRIEGAIEEAEVARENDLIREAIMYVRDNADLREQLIERGEGTLERLDAIGYVSHEHLDEAAERGELVEATYQALVRIEETGLGGMAAGLMKWLEKLHPRDRGGRFARKPGSGALEQRVGPDSRTDHTRDPGGPGVAKKIAKAPAGKKAEKVYKTQDVKPEDLAVQDREGLAPGQRPAGMSRRQAKQERPRTPEGKRRLRGQVQSEEEVASATEKDREKRTKELDERVGKKIKKGLKEGEGTPHWNEADKVSQRSLLDYVRNALTTPSTADAHGEERDGKRVYHPDRAQLHEAIIDVLLRRRNDDRTLSATNDYMPSQDTPQVLFMGGGYAAGKSSARKILEGRGEVPPDALTIDPDQIKSMLPEFAATAAHDPEANLRVYEEAWDIAQELQRRAQERKLNIIVDGITNTSVDEVIERVEGFKGAGYGDARIAYVDVPTEVALNRAGARAKKAAAEGDGPNMRHIPEPIMRAVHRDVAATIPALMGDERRRDLGLAIEVYDGQEGALPVATAAPDALEPEVHHDPAWTRLREKAGEAVAGVDAKESETDPFTTKRGGAEAVTPNPMKSGAAAEHEQHFDMKPDTPVVSLDKLRPSKAPEQQSKAVDAAEQALDSGEKRKPVKVRAEADGSYTVEGDEDSAAVGAALRRNWADMPVEVTNADEMPAAAGPAPLDPRDEQVARTIESALTDEERTLPKYAPDMPFTTEDELYAAAPGVHEQFSQVLDQGQGLSAALGAEVHSTASEEEFNSMLDAIEADRTKPRIVIGGIKGASRAREKVETNYGGNWGKLQDVVRATVVIPTAQDLPATIERLREEMGERGWKVSAVHNRMVEIPGSPNSPGKTSSGYSDFSLKLESPEGFQTELQINTPAMILEKERGDGHKLYEQERAMYAAAASRGLPFSAEERARIEDLRARQRERYTIAWEESLGGPAE